MTSFHASTRGKLLHGVCQDGVCFGSLQDFLSRDSIGCQTSQALTASATQENLISIDLELCWYMAVDALSTLDSLFSSIPPDHVVRDSGT